MVLNVGKIGAEEREVFNPEEMTSLVARASEIRDKFSTEHGDVDFAKFTAYFEDISEMLPGIPKVYSRIQNVLERYLSELRGKTQTELGSLESKLKGFISELEVIDASIKNLELEKKTALEKEESLVKEAQHQVEVKQTRYDDVTRESFVGSEGAFEDLENAKRALKLAVLGRISRRKEFEHKNSDLMGKKIEIQRAISGCKFGISERMDPLKIGLRDFTYLIVRNFEKMASGYGLNQLDITRIDTRKRVEETVGEYSDVDSIDRGDWDRLDSYRTSDTGLVPKTKNPGVYKQNAGEYLVDDEVRAEPTLFYTGQILETPNDSVSRRFTSCALVTVSSSSSKRRVSFHLPPYWEVGVQGKPNFSDHMPVFFYGKLKSFMAKENLKFKDLKVKIVSGVIVPPDEIMASFVVLGCDVEKVKVIQLPLIDYTALIRGSDGKILAAGKRVDFVERGQGGTRDDIFRTYGGNHRYVDTNEDARFVI